MYQNVYYLCVSQCVVSIYKKIKYKEMAKRLLKEREKF